MKVYYRDVFDDHQKILVFYCFYTPVLHNKEHFKAKIQFCMILFHTKSLHSYSYFKTVLLGYNQDVFLSDIQADVSMWAFHWLGRQELEWSSTISD